MYESEKTARLKPFRGEHAEWFDWREKFEALLDNNDLLDTLLEQRPTDVSAQVTWDKGSRKIYSKLVLLTEGTAAGIVGQFKTPRRDGVAAWKALIDKFERKGAAQRAALCTELFNSSLGEAEDPDAYFVRIERLQERLKTQGFEITDTVLQGMVLAKLPPNYATLRAIVDTEDDLDYPTFKARVRAFYSRGVTGKQEDCDAKALMGKHKKKVRCWNCGSSGHVRSNCPKPRDDTSETDDDDESRVVKCSKCGKAGHSKKQCKSRAGSEANTAKELAQELSRGF
jgi:hypothetical protein